MKKEIISQIEALTNQEIVLPLTGEFKSLTDQFYDILKAENHQWEVEKLERIEAGEKPEAIEKPVDEDFEKFKEITALFKSKRKTETDAIKAVEAENYKIKKGLIAQLKDLVDNEEHIGKAINAVKEIQQKWKDTGEVARDKRQALQKEYGHLMDDFRYNINIYKDITDHYKSKNLALKKEIIAALKELLALDKIKDVETNLRTLQNNWSEIGGTHQEEWEKIKDDYYNTVNAIYDKIRAFYDGRREVQKENIEKKKLLIERAKELNLIENNTHQDFQKTTEKFLALQDEWKTIGFGPKEENEKVWQTFRAEFNQFFDLKKSFYDERNNGFKEIKLKKENLIKEVEALKDSKDWKNTTNQIINIQKKWKSIGSAGPKFENRLWKAFRKHIDFFFDAKSAHFDQLDANNADNLNLKKALIDEIKTYKVGKDIKQTINDLKSFSTRFQSIGNVPFKVKDEIYKSYKSALDEKYNQIDLDKAEKTKVLFQAKLDSLMADSNPERALNNEKNNIRQSIDKEVKEKAQLENNLGFFANADENNPLLKSAKQNIAQIQRNIDQFKLQIKLINQQLNGLKKEEEVEQNPEAENE
ncbi:MAG: DUF349 domain-containing protein [Putridiphycobacter sp.]